MDVLLKFFELFDMNYVIWIFLYMFLWNVFWLNVIFVLKIKINILISDVIKFFYKILSI